MIYHGILNIVPRARHRTLLFIHPVYHSLCLLIPNMSSREPTLGNDLLSGAHTFPLQRGIPGTCQVNRVLAVLFLIFLISGSSPALVC